MASLKDQYRKIRHQIIVTHNPVKGMATFFASNSLSQIERFIYFLSHETFFNKAITGTAFPKEISRLGLCGNMPFIRDLDRTLLWYILDLEQNAKYINQFLNKKGQYDHAFLLGHYTLCEEILNQVHESFGYSLWEIQNRISLASETSGLDHQKQLTQQILSELTPGTVQYYCINSFSRQCESNVSVNTFLGSIDSDYRRFFSNGTPLDLCKYAKYKLNGYLLSDDLDFLNETCLAYFLYLDDKNALIDRYLSFTSVLSSVLVGKNALIQSKFIARLPTLIETISDPFLKNSYYIINHKFACYHLKGTEEISDALDKYSRGEYQTCITTVSNLILDDVVFFPLIEIYAKSCVFLQQNIPLNSEKCIINTILSKLRQLFSQSGDIQEIQRDLTKILYTHLDAAWSNELLQILEKYSLRLHSIESLKLDSLYSGISLYWDNCMT